MRCLGKTSDKLGSAWGLPLRGRSFALRLQAIATGFLTGPGSCQSASGGPFWVASPKRRTGRWLRSKAAAGKGLRRGPWSVVTVVAVRRSFPSFGPVHGWCLYLKSPLSILKRLSMIQDAENGDSLAIAPKPRQTRFKYSPTAVHKTERLSAILGSVVPKTPLTNRSRWGRPAAPPRGGPALGSPHPGKRRRARMGRKALLGGMPRGKPCSTKAFFKSSLG
jgi:hypothetical protein